MGRSLGISHSLIVVLATLITLALSFTAYVIGQQNLNIQQAVILSHAENLKTAVLEKLSLAYWDFNGRAWISNIGDIPVTIVKIYIDGQEVWMSAGKQPVTLNPGETVKLDLPYKGQKLAVETSTKSIYFLRG